MFLICNIYTLYIQIQTPIKTQHYYPLQTTTESLNLNVSTKPELHRPEKEPKRCKLYLTKVDRDYKTNTGFKVKSSLREG